MADLILRAEPRTILGKKVKQLRREGKVPAVVYGPVLSETVSVSVDSREFDRFFTRAGYSTLFTLRWEGGEQPVVIREVQMHPVRQTPIHVDFFAPNLRQELTATVPLTFDHEHSVADAVLTHALTELHVRSLPADIPQHIDVNLDNLTAVGDVLRAGDLTLPRGVTLVTPEDEVVASLSAVAVEAEPALSESVAEEASAPTDQAQIETAEAVSEGGES